MPKPTFLSLVLVLVLVLFLAACDPAPLAPPAPDSAQAPEVPPGGLVAGKSDSTEPSQGEAALPTAASDDNPTPVPPTATPTATTTSEPSPTPTQTPTATPTGTPEPILVEGVTLSDAEIYAGPADVYPWLATYTSGITLTVLGSDDSLKWLAVEIPPEQTGWVAESDLQLIEPPTELVLVPTPEALPTTAPLVGSTIQLTLVKQIYPPSSAFHGYQAAIAVVQTTQPKTPFTLEMISSKGKVVFREKSMTDATGNMKIYLPFRQAEGIYRVVVTTEAGDHDEASMEIKVIK